MPEESRRSLDAAAALARDSGVSLYLVGGAIRDLLLRRPVRDLDLVVEGDAPAFARILSRKLSASARVHPRFGTASLALPTGETLDIATSRTERYARPGALPEVEPAPIGEDLARRDFTVNAMALRVAPGEPVLLDPHAGRADLARRTIRMLHPASPRDDPTRAFRAVLYANRLGFRIEPRTRRSVVEAVRGGAVGRVSGDRLRREIARLLSEPGRAAAVAGLSRLGLAQAVHPALAMTPRIGARMRRAERLIRAAPRSATWFAFLLLWAADLTARQAQELGRRLNLLRAQARSLRRWPASQEAFAAGLGSHPTPDEALAGAALHPGRSRGERRNPTGVRGRDLVAAGIPPGPAIGRAIASARSARIHGRIAPGEELAFAIAAAREMR